MKKFKYQGDDPVDIPALGLVDVTKGTHVESEDVDVSASLESRDDFEHLPDPKRSAAAKAAAASTQIVGETGPEAVVPLKKKES